MCGGWIGDFLSDPIGTIGDTVSDVVESIVENPVGAITSVGLMMMGVPPVFAGAAGGAAGAAASGGDILKGAITGGAMGYVGGAAAGAATNAGAGSVLASAAGGAAAGGTGAAMTGGDIGQGIISGGLGGAAAGLVSNYIIKPNGTLAPVEDMSTWSPDAIAEQNALGNAVSVYDPATGGRTIYNTDTTQTVVNPDGGSYTNGADGSLTVKYADGSVYSKDAAGIEKWDYSQVGTPTAGDPNAVGNVVGGNQPAVDLTQGGTVNPAQPVMVPVIPPVTQAPATSDQYGLHPGFKTYPVIQGTGVNPGFVNATPFYHTTSDVQSQYDWGNHPYQAGPAFNPQLANQSAGPMTPWGLQQMDQPLSQADMIAASQGRYVAPVSAVAPATRVEAYHPVMQPAPTQTSGQIYLTPVGTPVGTNPYGQIINPGAPVVPVQP
jgi:hypothetical protein